MPEGGIGLVYCTHPGTVAADRSRAKELFVEREGVADVLEPDQFAAHGLPHPREHSQAPDLVLVAKDGYGVSGQVDGEEFVVSQTEGRVSLGSRGFLAVYAKMNAICVLAGSAIKKGVTVRQTENIDAAPTAARLLGVSEFRADGRVLDEVLIQK